MPNLVLRSPAILAAALTLMFSGFLAVTAGPAAAQAASARTAPQADAAQAFIRKVADESLRVMQDQSLPTEARRAKLQTIFNQHVAMDYIATLALGRYGRIDTTLPEAERNKQIAQIAEYRSRFPDFMFNKLYDILISKFDKSTIEVLGSKPIGSTDLYVNTKVIRPGQEPVFADWRVRTDKSGVLKVIDLRAEGISLTLTQRDEFASVLGTSSNPNDSLSRLLTFMTDKNEPVPPQAKS